MEYHELVDAEAMESDFPNLRGVEGGQSSSTFFREKGGRGVEEEICTLSSSSSSSSALLFPPSNASPPFSPSVFTVPHSPSLSSPSTSLRVCASSLSSGNSDAHFFVNCGSSISSSNSFDEHRLTGFSHRHSCCHNRSRWSSICSPSSPFCSSPSSSCIFIRFLCDWLSRIISQIPVILVGACFAILDNVPYGLLLFPRGYEHMSALGATMVILTTISSQLVFSMCSIFPFGAGAFAVENVPFLHALSTSVAFRLTSEQRPEFITSTIIACFVITSLLTASAFWILGSFKCGSFSNYVPKHVLLGCIGGMGIFIVTAGLGIASGVAWNWTWKELSGQVAASNIFKIGFTIVLEFILIFFGPRIRSRFFVPLFLLSVPILFYLVLFILGVPVATARSSGWIFDMADSGCASTTSSSGIDFHFPQTFRDVLNRFNIYSEFHWTLVDWRVVFAQFLTILAIVFFSVLHAPLNVPTLAFSSEIRADLNDELKCHGWSNLASALVGGGQSYMTYSSSILLQMCGLIDRWAGVGIAVLSSMFVLLGPSMFLSLFPRPAAAIFLVHVGCVLVRDGIIESYMLLDRMEYGVVWVISILMQYDFMQGVALGLILSFGLFVVQSSRVDAVAFAMTGAGLRSKQIRPRHEVQVLEDEMDDSIHVVKLQGTLFFGNAQQFLAYVTRALDEHNLKYLMVDFTRVAGLDCSGVDKLSAVVRLALSRGVTLVCAGMSDRVMERASCWTVPDSLPMEPATSSSLPNPPMSVNVWETPTMRSRGASGNNLRKLSDVTQEKIRFFADMGSALLWCEEQIIKDHQRVTTVANLAYEQKCRERCLVGPSLLDMYNADAEMFKEIPTFPFFNAAEKKEEADHSSYVPLVGQTCLSPNFDVWGLSDEDELEEEVQEVIPSPEITIEGKKEEKEEERGEREDDGSTTTTAGEERRAKTREEKEEEETDEEGKNNNRKFSCSTLFTPNCSTTADASKAITTTGKEMEGDEFFSFPILGWKKKEEEGEAGDSSRNSNDKNATGYSPINSNKSSCKSGNQNTPKIGWKSVVTSTPRSINYRLKKQKSTADTSSFISTANSYGEASDTVVSPENTVLPFNPCDACLSTTPTYSVCAVSPHSRVLYEKSNCCNNNNRREIHNSNISSEAAALVELLYSQIEQPREAVRRLVEYLELRVCERGQWLWRAGDGAEFACIVHSGLLAVPRAERLLDVEGGGGRKRGGIEERGKRKEGRRNSSYRYNIGNSTESAGGGSGRNARTPPLLGGSPRLHDRNESGVGGHSSVHVNGNVYVGENEVSPKSMELDWNGTSSHSPTRCFHESCGQMITPRLPSNRAQQHLSSSDHHYSYPHHPNSQLSFYPPLSVQSCLSPVFSSVESLPVHVGDACASLRMMMLAPTLTSSSSLSSSSSCSLASSSSGSFSFSSSSSSSSYHLPSVLSFVTAAEAEANRVVVDHPVWNERVFIHRGPFEEYFVPGQLAGDLGLLTGDRRSTSLVAVKRSRVWYLTETAVATMRIKEPYVMCVLQALVVKGAAHRLCYLMLHGSPPPSLPP